MKVEVAVAVAVSGRSRVAHWADAGDGGRCSGGGGWRRRFKTVVLGSGLKADSRRRRMAGL